MSACGQSAWNVETSESEEGVVLVDIVEKERHTESLATSTGEVAAPGGGDWASVEARLQAPFVSALHPERTEQLDNAADIAADNMAGNLARDTEIAMSSHLGPDDASSVVADGHDAKRGERELHADPDGSEEQLANRLQQQLQVEEEAQASERTIASADMDATSASLPRGTGVPSGADSRGERVFTQGDAAIANTLAAFTPGARGAVLLQQKMHNPLLVLSTEESLDVTLAGMQCGVMAREQAKGKELLMVIGNTGVGKSLFVNYLHGCQIDRAALPGSLKKVMAVSEGSACKEITQVGHRNQSMTFIPQLAADERFAYLDCPGFLDNRGPEISVANAVNTKSIVANSSGVRVVLLLNYNSLKSDRGAGLTDALKVLKALFGDSLLGACDSIQLGVTHVPLRDAEGEEDTTLDDVGRLFQDMPNKASEMTQVLDRLLPRLFIYHPMDRGHKSWRQRDELIQQINALPLIRDPLQVFHTVLSLADFEFLRNMVKALKDRTLDALQEDRFADAREYLQALDRMQVVQHPLASTIINEAKAEAHQRLQRLSDTVWEHSSHWRFDTASDYLHRLVQAAEHLRPHPLSMEAGLLHTAAAERLAAERALKERADAEKEVLAARVRVLESAAAMTRSRGDRLVCRDCNKTAKRSCPYQLCGSCCAGCSQHPYTRSDECRCCNNKAAQECPGNYCGNCCSLRTCPRH
jgi:hypothetical protein